MTVSRLRSWEPDELPAAARDLAEAAGTLRAQARAAQHALEQMRWTSPAADAARLAGRDVATALGSLAESLDLQAAVLRRVAGAVGTARQALARASALAADHGLLLLENGSCTSPPPALLAADADPDLLERVAAEQRAAREAQGRAGAWARQALAAAEEADRDAATALLEGDRVGALLAGVAPGTFAIFSAFLPVAQHGALERARLLDAVDAREVPDAGTDPREVAGWWAALPAGQQAALASAAPDLLGPLDGLPAAVRSAANVRLLAAQRAALEEQLRGLDERLADRVGPDWLRDRFTGDDDLRDLVRERLDAVTEVERVLTGTPGSLLLALDLSGRLAKAVVALGDVDHADHVAVFTPGFTTTVEGSLVGYARRLRSLQDQALALSRQQDGGAVATVAWLGYEAPQWGSIATPGRSVLSDGAAEKGAVDLERFLDGLDATRVTPAHLTALGHSYGSLTTSLALQRGTGADDVVLFGSPGLGTHDVRDLQVPHPYVLEARRDAVADLAAFGPDPNQMDGVTVLSTAREIIDGVERAESVGHSAYLTDDTTSQYAIAAVVAGHPELAPRRETRGIGDLLQTPVPGT